MNKTKYRDVNYLAQGQLVSEGAGFQPRHVLNHYAILFYRDCFPGGAVIKNPPANAGDTGDAGSIPGWGRSPGVGNVNLLHYSCLKNPMDRGVWRATVPGVTKSWT